MSHFTPPVAIFVTIFFTLQPDVFSQETEELQLEQLSGRQIYTLFCSRCHAEDGTGNIDPEMIAGMEAPPPDLTDGYFNSREKRKDWFAVIAHGGSVRGLSMSMPAWGHVLSERQINETIEYIKGFVDQRAYPQGELNFFRGHYTTKAFVEQEALLIPTYQSRNTPTGTVGESKLTLYYANRFGRRFQYEAKLPFHMAASSTSTATGIGNLEVGLKYAFYDDYRSLTILTAGIEAALPPVSETNGFGSGTVALIPYLAAGQGVGNLLQVSTSVKLETPLDRAKGDPELRAALLGMLTIHETKQGFFPGIEFFGRKNLSNSNYTLSIVPQIYWGITTRGHLAISFGAELPVAGIRPFDRRFVAFFLWDYVDGGLWW
ncbi:MAG TPA: cytochrome c [Bacteroidota bacterium]|nr:cytochrome c [Bacteroidota bacterium]